VPALTMCALQMLLLPLIGGNAPLDRPLPVPGTDDLLQYDDGSAYWLSWSGLYRGTWFDVDEFLPGYSGFLLDNLEYWFYHHASYPWDTASFYSELYDGDAAAPAILLNQTSVTAVHYAPCYAMYYPPEQTEADFWGLVNTEMSAGGWPSILGDNTPNPHDHSFYSEDFVAWTPWAIQGPTANDFFIRANGIAGHPDLDQTTWGSIKTLF